MSDNETELLRASMRALLATVSEIELPQALIAEGWPELLRCDAASACRLLFEEQGAGRASSAALDLVLLDRLGHDPDAQLAVIWPSVRRALEPSTRIADGAVSVSGVLLAGWQRATEYLVPAATAAETVLVRIPANLVRVTPLTGLDGSAQLARAEATVPLAEVAIELGIEDAVSWPQLATVAQRCIGYELVGLASSMLAIAVQQVSQRHQFGKAIATLQTVRHRLADIEVAIVAARRALDASWSSGEPVVTWAAKALAWRAAATATRDGQQVSGAMGFSWEHPLHQFGRRAHQLDSLLGPGSWLVDEIGRTLIASGVVPRAPRLA